LSGNITSGSQLPWENAMQTSICRTFSLIAVLMMAAAVAHADPIPAVAEASNMQIVGHSDLKGAGKGGEGLALRQYPNGQRVLFLAHESAPMCFTVIDVTKPEDPKVIAQIPVEAAFARCNSLGLSGTTLAVAHQVETVGQPYAGMDVYDVADPVHPRSCRTLTPRVRIRAACTIWRLTMASTPIFRPEQTTSRRATRTTISS
jgi:hypothetical protein